MRIQDRTSSCQTLAAFAFVALLGCGSAADDTTTNDEASGGEVVDSVEQAASADGQVCLTIQRGTEGSVADATIKEAAARWGDAAYPTVSTGTAGGGLVRAVLRFDLASVPEGATVTSATLSAYQLYKSTSGTVNVHRVTTPWNELTASWALLGSAFDSAVQGSFSFPANSFGFRSADVLGLVQDWVRGAVPNHGLMLDEPGAMGTTSYRSSEYTNVSQRPKLDLCYVTCNDGVQNGEETGVDCGGSSCASCCVPEVCDGVDNDCDGQVDEGSPAGGMDGSWGNHRLEIEGADFEFFSPSFIQVGTMSFSSDSQGRLAGEGPLSRTTRSNGCTTIMPMRFVLLGCNVLEYYVLGSDGACDLSMSYYEHRTVSRDLQ